MSTTGKWREEQILIVCPGSRTTMAQLGCNELTPPAQRIPTRMFQDGNEWRPYHTFQRKKIVNGREHDEWVEDVDSDEGATYPIQGGRIVNMDAFLAFLDHVHGLLTTTYHNTPIILMASPQWTRPDCEAIAQYIFEKTRTPALCMIHSGLATQYGLKWPNMTVVDIGFEKVDVTAIHDGRVVNHMDLGAPSPAKHISGGEVFTKSLLGKLTKAGFSYDMAEQLKRSPICEVLPYAAEEGGLFELPKEAGPEGAGAAASSASAVPQPTVASPEATRSAIEPPKPSGLGGGSGDGLMQTGEEDGVLDVAAIVTSGQTREFLARKEKEKEQQKEKGKPGRKPKDKEGDAGPTKAARLPNSKRGVNTFSFEEVVEVEVPREPKQPAAVNGTNGTSNPAPVANGASAPAEAPQPVDVAKPATDGQTVEPKAESDQPKPDVAVAEAQAVPAATAAPGATDTAAVPATTEAPSNADASSAAVAVDAPLEKRPKVTRRDIEVGLERFTFASRDEIDRIVSAIYRTIQGIDDMYMRPACWDNLVFVGNGARLRGLKENILQTLNARHLVSPSTATMFTSELPSNAATPMGTGSQTPTGSFTGAPPHQLSSGGGVNPLLQAATTASTINAGGAAAAAATPQAGSDAGGPGGAGAVAHHFHSQTPTSIKTASLPTYLGEWTKNGFEEAMFLGAQVAARIAFCIHSNMDTQAIEAQRLMSLSRVDYNELGPKGIRTHSMLG